MPDTTSGSIHQTENPESWHNSKSFIDTERFDQRRMSVQLNALDLQILRRSDTDTDDEYVDELVDDEYVEEVVEETIRDDELSDDDDIEEVILEEEIIEEEIIDEYVSGTTSGGHYPLVHVNNDDDDECEIVLPLKQPLPPPSKPASSTSLDPSNDDDEDDEEEDNADAEDVIEAIKYILRQEKPVESGYLSQEQEDALINLPLDSMKEIMKHFELCDNEGAPISWDILIEIIEQDNGGEKDNNEDTNENNNGDDPEQQTENDDA